VEPNGSLASSLCGGIAHPGALWAPEFNVKILTAADGGGRTSLLFCLDIDVPQWAKYKNTDVSWPLRIL